MTIEEIKSKIKFLSEKHAELEEKNMGDLNEVEWLETEAEEIIIAYCEEKNYIKNGVLTLNNVKEELKSFDNFLHRSGSDKFLLDFLTIAKYDVADLTWFYQNSFWPDFYENKDEFIKQIKDQLNSEGFYEDEI
jgi:hypothetical protein